MILDIEDGTVAYPGDQVHVDGEEQATQHGPEEQDAKHEDQRLKCVVRGVFADEWLEPFGAFNRLPLVANQRRFQLNIAF